MARRPHRTRLGPRFNEGARLLWMKLVDEFDGNQARLADELGASAGQVSRWLYGDRRPDLESAVRIEAKLGIAPSLFRKSPVGTFTLPTAVA